MSGLDALLWRVGQHPATTLSVTGVFVLDGTPDWSRFVAEHRRYAEVVPRFGQRVFDPPFGVGFPRWGRDPDFAVGRHLSRVRLPAPGGLDQVLEVAQAVARAPFDSSRPLWEAVLVELAEGRAAYVLKVHHSLMDGVSMARLLSVLYETDDRARQDAERSEDPPPPPSRATFPAAVRAGVTTVVSAVRHPVRTAKAAAKLARSVKGMVSGLDTGASPLLGERGGSWRFLSVDVPLADLRDAAGAVGATVNDGFTAAVLGGLRRYHEHFGLHPDVLPISVPLGDLAGQAGSSGNNMSLATLAGPVAEVDPVRRMRLVGDLVSGGRRSQSRAKPARLAGLVGLLPGALLAPAGRALARSVDVNLSNLRGPTEPLALAGCRILATIPFGPLLAVAVNATMLSYDGTCHVGVNLDAASVREPEVFRRCLVEGFDEVLAVRRR